jgi:hypothetical protein
VIGKQGNSHEEIGIAERRNERTGPDPVHPHSDNWVYYGVSEPGRIGIIDILC